jgi:hypothetical protein
MPTRFFVQAGMQCVITGPILPGMALTDMFFTRQGKYHVHQHSDENPVSSQGFPFHD